MRGILLRDALDVPSDARRSPGSRRRAPAACPPAPPRRPERLWPSAARNCSIAIGRLLYRECDSITCGARPQRRTRVELGRYDMRWLAGRASRRHARGPREPVGWIRVTARSASPTRSRHHAGRNPGRRVAIIGGVRIPFARSMGAYAECSNQQMLTAALQALVDKYSLAGERLGDVGAGAVLKSSRDFNLTRESVLRHDLDPQTPAFDLQRACGTSLETAILLGLKIARARSTAALRPASTRPAMRRSASMKTCGRSCCAARAAAVIGRAAEALARAPARALEARCPGGRRAAHGADDGAELRADGADAGASSREAQEQLALESHHERRRPTTRAFSATSWSSTGDCGRTTTCGATRRWRSSRAASPHFRCRAAPR